MLSPQANLKDILGELLNLAETRLKDCEKKQWKPDVFGCKIDLSKPITGFCDGLDKFKKIGDVIVQFDPVHTALPWSGVRTMLMV
jgi:hypothetical protein